MFNMKENHLQPREWSDNQRRIFIDAVQLYEAHIAAFREGRSYRGGMHWKKSKGKEYLFRSTDRFGYGKSLGPRSSATEKIIQEFRKGKERNKSRLATLKDRLKEQARFCRAAAIQRVPRIVAGVLRVLDQYGVLGRNLCVIGTNALYAYEAAAGVFVDRPILATQDMDLLWDIQSRLKLVAEGDQPPPKLLDILRKADRSFARHKGQGFRAVNKEGYLVDLVKPEPRNVMALEPRRMGEDGDLVAAEIRSLQWLVSSPKFTQIVVGDDGYPAAMTCPDPRAFALHKIWLSERADRDPLKKKRDRHQGLTVAYLIARYLPQFRFNAEELRMIPKKVFDRAGQEILKLDVPPEFG
jgi:hypothetical protein